MLVASHRVAHDLSFVGDTSADRLTLALLASLLNCDAHFRREVGCPLPVLRAFGSCSLE